jgi:hypothetical protein
MKKKIIIISSITILLLLVITNMAFSNSTNKILVDTTALKEVEINEEKVISGEIKFSEEQILHHRTELGEIKKNQF